MPAITIRNVPPAVRNALAARAASTGQSLQEYLHAELEALAGRATPNAWASRVAARQRTSDLDDAEIVELVAADRR